MKLDYNAPLTLVFCLICVVVFVVSHWFLPGIANLFILFPDQTHIGKLLFSFISNIFGHADLNHLLSNLTFLLLLGPILEEKFGVNNILKSILITTIITSLINYFFIKMAVCGSSGIVFLFIVLASFGNAKKGTIPVTLILVLIFFIGKEIYGLKADDKVAQFAHILGGLCGAGLGFYQLNQKRI